MESRRDEDIRPRREDTFSTLATSETYSHGLMMEMIGTSFDFDQSDNPFDVAAPR